MRSTEEMGPLAIEEHHASADSASLWQTIRQLQEQVNELQLDLRRLQLNATLPVTQSLKKAEPALKHGRVRWYSTRLGYGFIEADSGRDFFLHHSAIAKSRPGNYTTALPPGTAVTFIVKQSRSWARADEAKRVTAVQPTSSTGRHGNGQRGERPVRPQQSAAPRATTHEGTGRHRRRRRHDNGGRDKQHRRPTGFTQSPTHAREAGPSLPATSADQSPVATATSMAVTYVPGQRAVAEMPASSCPAPEKQTCQPAVRERLIRLNREAPTVRWTPQSVTGDAPIGCGSASSREIISWAESVSWAEQRRQDRQYTPPCRQPVPALAPVAPPIVSCAATPSWASQRRQDLRTLGYRVWAIMNPPSASNFHVPVKTSY